MMMSLLRSAVVGVTITSMAPLLLLLHLPMVVDSAPLPTTTTTTVTNLRTPTDVIINKEYEKIIEETKELYKEYGCLSSWDSFPSIMDYERERGSTRMTAITRSTAAATAATTTTTTKQMSMACMCGLLHDSASLIFEEFLLEDVSSISSSLSSSSSSSSISLSAAIAAKRKEDAIAISVATTTTTTTTTDGDTGTTISAVQQIQPSSISSTTKYSDTVRSLDLQQKCDNGKAGDYDCKNVDLILHIPLTAVLTTNAGTDERDLEPPTGGNDVWGWTYIDTNDNDSRREFVLWGTKEGLFFVEATNFKEPKIVGYLPSTTKGKSNWRDMKVIKNHAYIGSEMGGHGMQIFDLTQLLNVECVNEYYCKEFSPRENVYTGGGSPYRPVTNSHNIVANEDTDFVYIVGGTNGCAGGLHIVDVSDPENPTFAGCYGGDGYVHDAECVVYDGVDTTYFGNEICFCFNANSVTIVDVTDKTDFKLLSRTQYAKTGYTHQGWLSSDKKHIVFGDETDEYRFGGRTRSLILNIEDLEKPTNFQEYFGTTTAIDHNLYIARAVDQGYENKFASSDLIYQSNYQAGLRILQVPDIDNDYDNDPDGSIIEVAYFDTFPMNDSPKFNGAWSVYPFFSSQLVAISDVSGGLFLVKPNLDNVLVSPPTQPPTQRPTQRPTQPPTQPPTPPPTQAPISDVSTDPCDDLPEYLWRGKSGRGCDWVGRPNKNKKIRKRCKKFEIPRNNDNSGKRKRNIPGQKRIHFYCPTTCGDVGKGSCKS